MKKLLIAMTLAATMAFPAHAFLNPRTTAFVVPDKKNPGYGIIRLEVLGSAWKCVGRVKYPDEQLVDQSFNMQCKGMAKSASATIQRDGEFFYEMRYRLNIGIKGYVSLS